MPLLQVWRLAQRSTCTHLVRDWGTRAHDSPHRGSDRGENRNAKTLTLLRDWRQTKNAPACYPQMQGAGNPMILVR
jgi:hypothetical protein